MTCPHCHAPMISRPPTEPRNYISLYECVPCKTVVFTPLGYAERVNFNVTFDEPKESA